MSKDQFCCSFLIVEDNEGDYFLVHFMILDLFPNATVLHNRTLNEANHSLEIMKFDVVLLDLTLPDSEGLASITQIVASAVNTPVIVLTGYSDRDFGVSTLSSGVADYLLKDELHPMVLYKSISYSIERTKIASRLIESEDKYREIFQLSPIPKWVYDIRTGLFLNVNEAAIANYGYTLEEFLNLKYSDLMAEVDYPENNPETNSGNGIYRHKRKNGSIIMVDVRSKNITFDGKQANLVLADDITDELINKEKVIRYNQRLKAAQEIGMLGYWEIDIQTKKIFWSDEVYKILGVEDLDSPLSFELFYAMVHPEDKAMFDARIKGSIAGIHQDDMEYRVICPDQSIKYLFHRCELVNNSQGILVKCEGVVQDITERRNHVQAIERQNARLKDIAWIQSHVVRAPLSRLMGLVSILNQPFPLAMSQHELVEKIMKSAVEVDEIIREIVKKTEQIEDQTKKWG